MLNMKYTNLFYPDRINSVSWYQSTCLKKFIAILKKYLKEYNESKNGSTETSVYHSSTVEVSTSFAIVSDNFNFNICSNSNVKDNGNIWCCTCEKCCHVHSFNFAFTGSSNIKALYSFMLLMW